MFLSAPSCLKLGYLPLRWWLRFHRGRPNISHPCLLTFPRPRYLDHGRETAFWIVHDCMHHTYIHQLKKNDLIKFDVFQHNISTRGNGNRLVVPKSKNEAGRRSFNTQGALIFNSLPEHVRNEKSILIFKRLVKNFQF